VNDNDTEDVKSVTRAMSTSTRSELNRGTPNVTVYSNQGLAIRQLSYYRRAVGETAETRINFQRYDSAGQLISSIDPRLSSAASLSSRQTPAKDVVPANAGNQYTPNQQQRNTLNGAVLKSENVDAGSRVLLLDIKGQPIWNWDSRGTESRVDYDTLRRVIAVHEKERSKASVCRERFRYGESSDATARCNRVGQLLEHYDTAGRRLMPNYNLSGQATQEERSFLKVEEAVNWTDDDAWQSH
jgi:insecticidal toxin complex protein TccC